MIEVLTHTHTHTHTHLLMEVRVLASEGGFRSSTVISAVRLTFTTLLVFSFSFFSLLLAFFLEDGLSVSRVLLEGASVGVVVGVWRGGGGGDRSEGERADVICHRKQLSVCTCRICLSFCLLLPLTLPLTWSLWCLLFCWGLCVFRVCVCVCGGGGGG